MIVVISGSNRPNNNSRRVAHKIESMLHEAGEKVFFIDLEELPADLFIPASYACKPESFTQVERAVLTADGILTVVPEYNGSFPGALKYFIDLLPFPDCFAGVPSAFVGLAAGRWGGLRAVEQLEMVFQYRNAHLFGGRVFLPNISALLGEDGNLSDQDSLRRLKNLASGFVEFCGRLPNRTC